MAVKRRYQCPDCDGVFDFFHHPDNEPPPSFCPLCGADVRVNPDKPKRKARKLKPAAFVKLPGDIPYTPTSRVASRSGDQVYRDMESASLRRQQEAADLLGVDARSLPNMKMTNMKDNTKVGEVSYMPAAATKLQGSVVRMTGTAPDGVSPVGNFGGAQGQVAIPGQAPVAFSRPGAPVPEMQAVTSVVTGGHSMRAAATAAAGKK